MFKTGRPNEVSVILASCFPESAIAAGRRLQSLGCKTVIVTLGENGCVVVVDRRVEVLPAMQVEAVDATAAGDAYSGVLAASLAEGATLIEAAQRASVAAGLSVTKEGAQPSLPMREEIEANL